MPHIVSYFGLDKAFPIAALDHWEIWLDTETWIYCAKILVSHVYPPSKAFKPPYLLVKWQKFILLGDIAKVVASVQQSPNHEDG